MLYIYIYILYFILYFERKEAQINLITKYKPAEIHIGGYIIKSSDCEILLGSFIFDDHL